MKSTIRQINLILIMGILSLSCEDDIKQSNSEIFGTWNLISYQCCLSPSENYDQSEILWTFSNDGEFTANINTELEDNSQIPFQNSVTLTYTKTDTTVLINQSEYDYRIEETGMLVLSDSPESDGAIIILIK